MKNLKLIPASMFVALLATSAFAQTAADPNRPIDSTNNVVRTDREPEHNYGWIGLLGLAGLAGLVRRPHAHEHTDSRHTSPGRV